MPISSDMVPTVSILVTVYNREPFLAQCLDSILASSYQDFEVVVVDDRSNDHSWSIAKAYAARDPRIRVFRNPANLGDYGNRNRAAELALGRYLKYLDADDTIYPHSLGLMVEAMERFPEAGLGLSLNRPEAAQPYPFVSTSRDVLRGHFLGKSVLGCGPSASIIRRDAFERFGGFSGKQFLGDTELWLNLASSFPVVSLPPALVWWRVHDGQQMSLEMRRPEVLVDRFLMESSFLGECCLLSGGEKRIAQRRLARNHARRLLSIARRVHSPLQLLRLLRKSNISFKDVLYGILGYR